MLYYTSSFQQHGVCSRRIHASRDFPTSDFCKGNRAYLSWPILCGGILSMHGMCTYISLCSTLTRIPTYLATLLPPSHLTIGDHTLHTTWLFLSAWFGLVLLSWPAGKWVLTVLWYCQTNTSFGVHTVFLFTSTFPSRICSVGGLPLPRIMCLQY